MSLQRKLFVIAVVYVVEGFPMGIFTGVVPFFQREAGYSLAAIGFVSWLRFAWSLKVFWSPLVNRFGDRRHWIIGAQLAMAAALLVISNSTSNEFAVWLGIGITAYCIASATQDIAIDAYTIGMLDAGQEGPGNAMRNTGYRIGMVLLANGLLFLPRWIGWSSTFVAAAALHAVMALTIIPVPRVEVAKEARREMWAATYTWMSRSGVIPVFCFIMLYRVGDSAMAPMIPSFWKDSGFTPEEFGTVSGMLGFAAMLPGAWLAASIVTRLGIGRALVVTGVFALLSNLGYAAAAAWPETGRAGVYAASISESFCGGMAGVAFMSFLMRICQKEHAAVQYALLTALYNLIGTGLGGFSGVLTPLLTYAGYFALTAAFALPAFAFLPAARRWLEPEAKPT